MDCSGTRLGALSDYTRLLGTRFGMVYNSILTKTCLLRGIPHITRPSDLTSNWRNRLWRPLKLGGHLWLNTYMLALFGRWLLLTFVHERARCMLSISPGMTLGGTIQQLQVVAIRGYLSFVSWSLSHFFAYGVISCISGLESLMKHVELNIL